MASEKLDRAKFSALRKEQIQAHRDREALIRLCTRRHPSGHNELVLDRNNLPLIAAADARVRKADDAVLRFLRGVPSD